jgi:hypothetical protein
VVEEGLALLQAGSAFNICIRQLGNLTVRDFLIAFEAKLLLVWQ